MNNPDLPAPDGRNVLGADAFWRLSSGDLLFVRGQQIYSSVFDPRTLWDIEADALAALAAVTWARGEGE